MELLTTLVLSVGINLAMFVPAFLFKTDKLTDISYAITFVVVSGYAFIKGGASTASIILGSMILLWAIRIGSYLFIRIRKIGKDKRFDERRNSFWGFLGFWLLQGLTVWVVLIPSIIFFTNGIIEIPRYAYLGLGIWAVGLIVETVADIQKYRFINNPSNKGKWIGSGLWKYSRHPNYFGEILLWIGVYVFAFFGLDLWQAFVGLLSPLYIASLIMFVSGVPLLEKAADKRWGDNPVYNEYKKRTSILAPLPNKNV
ncbi:DUF1295 domain-containing protein [Patescibacteria group bacterium]|nr:DUF1295 domain-containing protein [Patescibacteria group bacterium]